MHPERARHILAAVAELAEVRRTRAAAARQLNDRHCFIPQTPHPKQRQFLALTCREALFGGSAGPGKSSALLMAALAHVDQPHYAALLIRRTYRDLALPGALMDRAGEWLRPTAARWNAIDKQWRFPSGATLSFGHLDNENDKYRYQGSELNVVCFDELSQFTETQYTYLLSRLRRPAGSQLPLMCRSASNPGGIGHAWVKRRFVDEGGPDDRIFIPARLDDNPSLDTAEYEDSLRGLDPITYRQLRDGEWVTDAGALIYPFESHHMVAAAPPLPDVVLGMDLGSSMSKPTTAITALGSTPAEPMAYVLESEARACLSPTDSAEFLRELYDRHAPMAVVVDPGGMGQAYVDEFQKRHNLPCQPAIRRNKLAYRKYFRGDLAHHKLRVVEPACRLLLEEAAQLRWDEREIDCEKGATDHRTDSMIFAYAWLWHYLHEPSDVRPPRGSPEEIEEAIEAEQDAEAEQIAQRRARRRR